MHLPGTKSNSPTLEAVLQFLIDLVFLTASVLLSDVFWQVDPFTTLTIACIVLFCSSFSNMLKDLPLRKV